MKIDAKELKGKGRERGRKKRQRQKRVPARSSALRFGILMSCTQSGKLKQRLQKAERESSKRETERQKNRLIETGE